MNDTIGAVDYVVIVIILLIPITIGIYHGFKDQIIYFVKRVFKVKSEKEEDDVKKTKTGDYLTANSSMSTLPIAFSLLATFYSATALLGMPAELYQYGIQAWISVFGIFPPILFGAFVTGPFFAKLEIVSVFEYIELRFNSKITRMVGTTFYVLKNFISSAIFIYGPAAALTSLTNLDQKISIGLIGVIGTFYTTLGGIRGVIWTDLFQGLIMLSSLLMLVIKGIVDVGGFENLFRINNEGGRLNFFDFNPDPFIRQQFWSLVFGQTIISSFSYAFDQQMVQRFRAAKSKNLARRALLLNIPGSLLTFTLCYTVGLIVYAIFAKCDPFTNPNGKISSPNELVGLFVMKSLSMYPGLPGIFLGALFCGSLSSVSSTLGSQSSIIWQDYFKLKKYFRDMKDSQSLIVNKLIVLFCGLTSTGLSFLISSIGGNLIQISGSLNGSFSAPIIGIFMLALFFPKINSIGVIIGACTGFAATLWVSMGAIFSKISYPKLSVSIEGCEPLDLTTIIFQNTTTPVNILSPPDGLDKFYSLSYQLYASFGMLVTIVVGVIVSLATCGFKENTNDKYMIFNFLNFFSKKRTKIGSTSEMHEINK